MIDCIDDIGDEISRLDKEETRKTIDKVLKKIHGIEKLGKYYSADRIPFPIRLTDIASAVLTILEKKAIEGYKKRCDYYDKKGKPSKPLTFYNSFFKKNKAPNPNGTLTKCKLTRSYPLFNFIIEKGENNYRGSLIEKHNDKYLVLYFINIPIPE